VTFQFSGAESKTNDTNSEPSRKRGKRGRGRKGRGGRNFRSRREGKAEGNGVASAAGNSESKTKPSSVVAPSAPRRAGGSERRSARRQPTSNSAEQLSNTSASGDVVAQKPVLPYRVKSKDLDEICDLFGPHANGTGAIGVANTWKVLDLLGKKHFHPDGRWLPKSNLGRGHCCGVKWRMCINSQTIDWSREDFRRGKLIIQYPSGREGELSLHELLRREILAEFRDFTFCAPLVSAAPSSLGMVGILFDLRKTRMYKCFAGTAGVIAGYFKTGSMHYVIDDSVMKTDGGAPSHIRSLIPVPSCLLENLYPKAAGRTRDEKLLRELMRHAELIVKQSPLVPEDVRGIVSMRLAFLAMVHNRRFEEAMYKHIVPGSLAHNELVSKLWSGVYRGWKIRMWVTLFFGSLAYLRWNYLVRKSWGGLQLLLGAVPGLKRITLSDAVAWFWSAIRPAYWEGAKNKVAVLLAAISAAAIFTWNTGSSSGWVRGNILSLFGMPAKGTLSATGVLQVILEELSKRTPPHAGWLIPVVECARWGWRYPPTLVMHIICGKLPLPLGVCGHLLFNTLAERQQSAFLRQPVEVDDECVDEFQLRENEEVASVNKISLPHGYPLRGKLPCCEPKRPYYYVALSVEGVQVTVFRNCICNERAAIMSRVTAKEDSTSKTWKFWFSRVRKMGRVVKADVDKWLQHLPSRARGLLSNKATLSLALTSKDYIQKAFVKREKRISVVGTRIIKPNAAPRLIQGRSLNIKIATGPWTWSYSKKLKSVYHPRGLFLYAGGRSAEEVGDFVSSIKSKGHQLSSRALRCVKHLDSNHQREELLAGACWVAIDCKRWDSTVGSNAMEALYEDYVHCGAPEETLLALKPRSGVRKGFTQNGIKYERKAQVSSGDGDTSGGNSRLHLVLLESCPYVLAGMVSGDDALIYTAFPELVCDHYRKGGMHPVPAPEIDFCSALFYPTSDGTVLGPKIGRILAKTFHCMHHLPGKYLEWVRGVCMSLRKSTSFIPILRVLIPRFLELTEGRGEWLAKEYEYKIWASHCHSVTERTWSFMLERYGLGEAEILELEGEIRRLSIGDRLTGDTWLSIVDRDA